MVTRISWSVTVDSDTDPARMLEDMDTRQHLVRAIEALPEREKLMMGLYTNRNSTFVKSGEVAGGDGITRLPVA